MKYDEILSKVDPLYITFKKADGSIKLGIAAN